jgi:hypothetical protein
MILAEIFTRPIKTFFIVIKDGKSRTYLKKRNDHESANKIPGQNKKRTNPC